MCYVLPQTKKVAFNVLHSSAALISGECVISLKHCVIVMSTEPDLGVGTLQAGKFHSFLHIFCKENLTLNAVVSKLW